MPGTGTLLLTLSGRAYPVDGPAVLVPRRAIAQADDVVEHVVAYPPSAATPPKGPAPRELLDPVQEQLDRAIATHPGRRVVYLAKSLGGTLLSQLVNPAPDALAIWLTPLLGRDYVREGIVGHGLRSLVVAGGADTHHEPAAHDAVVDALRCSSLVLADADHDLEVAGDVEATLERWRQLARAVIDFTQP